MVTTASHRLEASPAHARTAQARMTRPPQPRLAGLTPRSAKALSRDSRLAPRANMIDSTPLGLRPGPVHPAATSRQCRT